MGKKLYKNIRAAMVRKNFNQADMAKKMGIKEPSFNRKINGRANWTLNDVNLLMELLDLTFEEVSAK